MAMTATARRAGNSLKHEVDVNGRHTIVTDEPEHLGGTDEGPRHTSCSPRPSPHASRR